MQSDLKPRAIAALVCLRSGPRNAYGIRNAIGDARLADTNALIKEMLAANLLAKRPTDGGRYYLDHEGLGWLQRHGLDAVPEARAWETGGQL